MFFQSEICNRLKDIKKPEDLVETRILSDKSTPLKIHTGITHEEESLLNSPSVCITAKRLTKKVGRNQSMWDVDISSTGPGHFDDAGNFIMSRSKKIPVNWLVKKGSVVEGPFTEKEMKAEAEKGNLKDTLIKRDFDKGYVCANNLMQKVPEFFTGENLNKYFFENQIVEAKDKQDDFYSNVVMKEKNTKLGNFMKQFNITASPEFIIKTISGMRKAEAIDSIASITGLNRSQNEILVELIIEHAKTQILKDVDKDGFEISSAYRGKKYYSKK